MRKQKFLVLSAFVLSFLSGLGLAETGTPAAGTPAGLGKQSALEGLGKKAARDTTRPVTSAELPQGEKAVEQATEKAATAKETAQNAPAAAKEKAEKTAEKAVKSAVPEEAKTGAKAVEEGAGTDKEAPKAAGKAGKSAKSPTGK